MHRSATSKRRALFNCNTQLSRRIETMETRIPFSEAYVRLVGIAVYVFSYYEWQIIYIIDELKPGFVSEYSRSKILTSKGVYDKFSAALECGDALAPSLQKSLACCQKTFNNFIPRRNALIHAHPVTDPMEGQILHYQTTPSRPISDLRWNQEEVETFIADVDKAACEANSLFYCIKKSRVT